MGGTRAGGRAHPAFGAEIDVRAPVATTLGTAIVGTSVTGSTRTPGTIGPVVLSADELHGRECTA
ncbi:MAG TPA: hypothetical protein VGD91_31685 [Trebonia sp.]